LIVTIAGTAVFLVLALARRWQLLAGALNRHQRSVLAIIFASRVGRSFAHHSGAGLYQRITDPSPPGLGLIGAAFGLGFIFGPAIGGFLSQWGYAVPAYAAAGLAFRNLLGVCFLLPESITPEHRATHSALNRPLISLRAVWDSLHEPLVGPLLNIRFFFALAAALFQTIFTLWAKDRLGLSAQTTAYILAYVGLLLVIVQGGVVGRLSKRYSDRQLIFWSILIQVPALLLWAFTPSVPVLLLVLIPLAFSTGVLNTIINTSLTRVVGPEEIGGTLGISASLESLSRIISPAVGGWLLGNVGTWAPGVLASLIMSGTAIMPGRLMKRALGARRLRRDDGRDRRGRRDGRARRV
jgi:DHA1 family tetracycline resistance protein-like MFS transporter